MSEFRAIGWFFIVIGAAPWVRLVLTIAGIMGRSDSDESDFLLWLSGMSIDEMLRNKRNMTFGLLFAIPLGILYLWMGR